MEVEYTWQLYRLELPSQTSTKARSLQATFRLRDLTQRQLSFRPEELPLTLMDTISQLVLRQRRPRAHRRRVLQGHRRECQLERQHALRHLGQALALLPRNRLALLPRRLLVRRLRVPLPRPLVTYRVLFSLTLTAMVSEINSSQALRMYRLSSLTVRAQVRL